MSSFAFFFSFSRFVSALIAPAIPLHGNLDAILVHPGDFGIDVISVIVLGDVHR